MARKLSKKLFHFSIPKQPGKFRIPNSELKNFETALKETDWNKLLSGVDAEADSDILLTTIKNTIDEFTRKGKTNKRQTNRLSWLNSDVWRLMKQHDQALK